MDSKSFFTDNEKHRDEQNFLFRAPMDWHNENGLPYEEILEDTRRMAERIADFFEARNFFNGEPVDTYHTHTYLEAPNLSCYLTTLFGEYPAVLILRQMPKLRRRTDDEGKMLVHGDRAWEMVGFYWTQPGQATRIDFESWSETGLAWEVVKSLRAENENREKLGFPTNSGFDDKVEQELERRYRESFGAAEVKLHRMASS